MVEVEVAALAAPGPQQRGSDAALALAQPGVERDEVVGQVGDDRSALGVESRQRLVDLGEPGLARRADLGDLGVEVGDLRGEGVEAALRLLEPLHHLELVVLERGDATGQRHHLLLHPLEVLGVADQALVHPLLVALAPCLDRLDVGVDLALLEGQVVDRDPGVLGLAVDLGPGLGQLGEPGGLGEGASLVPELVGSGVQVLQVEQPCLGGRVGLHTGSSGAGFIRGS